jgi:hypothetical protein
VKPGAEPSRKRQPDSTVPDGTQPSVTTDPQEEKMSSPLVAAAGPVALVAGLAFAAVDLARLLTADRSLDRIEMMRQAPFQVTNALYWVVFIGLVLALVSVYFRSASRAGGLGAVGFCFALVGTLDMASNMWFDGFAAPWIADVAPGAILAGGSGMLAVGGLSSYVLCARLESPRHRRLAGADVPRLGGRGIHRGRFPGLQRGPAAVRYPDRAGHGRPGLVDRAHRRQDGGAVRPPRQTRKPG